MNVSYKLIINAAISILRESSDSTDEIPPLGAQWVKRFLQRHPQYKRVKKTDIELFRKLVEDPEVI